MRNEQNDLAEENSSWIINDLLDVLVCSIADRIFLLVFILTRLQARQNTAQLVKILSDTTNQNV